MTIPVIEERDLDASVDQESRVITVPEGVAWSVQLNGKGLTAGDGEFMVLGSNDELQYDNWNTVYTKIMDSGNVTTSVGSNEWHHRYLKVVFVSNSNSGGTVDFLTRYNQAR